VWFHQNDVLHLAGHAESISAEYQSVCQISVDPISKFDDTQRYCKNIYNWSDKLYFTRKSSAVKIKEGKKKCLLSFVALSYQIILLFSINELRNA